ncbi:MAG: nitroreductase family protein, partial [Candidatus Adiutrix sp.]|nr:nitroreductase family protein [Candidatus Adiutrix sp.]
MNAVIQALMERRSIRKFSPEAIDEGDLQTILTAGIFAPSARNAQAWHATAVVGAEAIGKLSEAVRAATGQPGFDKYKGMADKPSYTVNYKDAPVFVIVSVDPAASFAPQEDGALMLGNMLLAAHALGLGACWINQLGPIADEPEFRKLLTGLGVPQGYAIVGCAAIGRRAGENPAAPARQDGLFNLGRGCIST